MLSERRGYLLNEEMDRYKETIDLMQDREEQILQSILENLYLKIDTTEGVFQQSLHSHCNNDSNKKKKLREITEHASKTMTIMRPLESQAFSDHPGLKMNKEDIIEMTKLIHKI